MTSEHSSEQPPAKLGRRSVADRVRSYRRRRRRGLRCIQVQVGRAELDGLVADGYLLPGNREDSYHRFGDQRPYVRLAQRHIMTIALCVTALLRYALRRSRQR